MRPGAFLCAFLLAGHVFAQDARIQYLGKQLTAAKDPRTRAQSAVILGASGNPAAVPYLCTGLRDAEPIVRSAAANALGELRLPEGDACLKGASKDSDSQVRAAVQRALEDKGSSANVKAGGLYIAVDPVSDKVGSLSQDVLKLADGLIREKVASMGGSLAPVGETRAQASSLINKHQLKGYLLRTNLMPNGTNGLKLEMLIMTYPDQALQGTWNVKAAGGKYEAQLKAMVPRVVDDAARDLEWK